MNFSPPPEIAIDVPPLPFASGIKKGGNGWAGVFRDGGIGDNLMASSPLPLLKKKFGKVEVLTGDKFGIMFKNNPHIDKLSFTKPPGPNIYTEWMNARATEYDGFYCLNHSCETSLALFPAQTHFSWPASMRRKFCRQNYLEFVHDVCEVPYEFGPLFFPTNQELEQARDTKRKVGEQCIVWIISGTRLDKVHPYTAE